MFQGGADGTTETTVGRVTVAAVRAATDHVAMLVGALDPDDVLYSESVELWQEFSRLGRLANAGSTLVARRVDESRRWAKAGHRTVDDFFAADGGESLGDARKQRRTSERLRDLPDTEEQLRRGRLSREQSDVITDAAAANPAAEGQLLDDAEKKSVRDLKDQANRAKAAGDRDPEATAKRIRRCRKLSSWAGSDGSHQFFGKGPVDDAAVIEAALRPFVDGYYRTRRNTPDQAERQAYMWDALVELARQQLNDTTATNTGGTSDGGADSTDSGEGGGEGAGNGVEVGEAENPPKRPRRPAYLGILRMDLAALVRGWVEGDEVCEIAGLGPVPVTRARELLGESSLRLVLTNGIDVQNVTYLGRGVNAAQQIALLWSQPICTNIACGNTWLQNDHRQPFAKVRKTVLANIDPICPHDHHLKTHHNWQFVPGTGRRPFVPPDHPHHPNNLTRRAPPPSGDTRAGPAPPRPQPDAHRPAGNEPEVFPDTG